MSSAHHNNAAKRRKKKKGEHSFNYNRFHFGLLSCDNGKINHRFH